MDWWIIHRHDGRQHSFGLKVYRIKVSNRYPQPTQSEKVDKKREREKARFLFFFFFACVLIDIISTAMFNANQAMRHT